MPEASSSHGVTTTTPSWRSVLRPPQARLHQGALYAGVPVVWLPPPLWVMRPRRGRMEDLVARLADEQPDASSEGGQEIVLAEAKARPVVVLGSYAELRSLRAVRIVPLYSYRPGSGMTRMRKEIEDRKVGTAFHLTASEELGVHEGALRLDQAQPVDAGFLQHQVASLTDGALAALIDHAVRYIRNLDRRNVA